MYKRQRQVLEFLREFIEQHGFAPTIREIAKALGIRSPATVDEHLRALEQKGVIRRSYGKRRSISISDQFKKLPQNKIPILGQIAAGEPIEAIENPDDFVQFPSGQSGKELYALKVKGSSMIEDGIFEGDVVVIQKQDNCENGQAVVALLPDGSATLKRLYREKSRIRLQPANADFEPIYVRNVRIQGRVIGLVRKF